jgi:hypothetical protein
MDVLVIVPGHGSEWIENAVIVDRLGNPNPRGRFVQGTSWYHEGGWNIPEGGIDIPERVTYPRRFILKIDGDR